MRTFLNGNNVDTTATVLAYLTSSAARELKLADLVLIGEMEDPLSLFLTNWESPLSWPLWGTFQPAAMFDRGKITSQIGLKVDSMQFSWSPVLTAFGSTLASANIYQKAQSGFFDKMKFRLWRTVMPTPGDANTYGACEVFGGRVSGISVGRGAIKLTVTSFLDVVNQLVPPNVIELTSTLANYAGHVPVIADGETAIPQFQVVPPTSPTNIIARCLSPNPGKVYSAQKFRYGFIIFDAGSTLAGYWSPIASQASFKTGGISYNGFTVYGGFPWPPSVGDTFHASAQPPINLTDPASAYWYYAGFPYVPQPETAV